MTPDEKYRVEPDQYTANHPHFLRGRTYERALIADQFNEVIAECDDSGCQACIVLGVLVADLMGNNNE
jgi:hypothetical protein